jgi:hypothetical protein
MEKVYSDIDGPLPPKEVSHERIVDILLLIHDYITVKPTTSKHKYNTNSVVAAKSLAVIYVILGSALTQCSTITQYKKTVQASRLTNKQLYYYIHDFRSYLKDKYPKWKGNK